MVHGQAHGQLQLEEVDMTLRPVILVTNILSAICFVLVHTTTEGCTALDELCQKQQKMVLTNTAYERAPYRSEQISLRYLPRKWTISTYHNFRHYQNKFRSEPNSRKTHQNVDNKIRQASHSIQVAKKFCMQDQIYWDRSTPSNNKLAFVLLS